ncbi:DNA-binding transcriptional regulator, AcrR family [Nakamurella panacisegetis]|uniref:DNA-binding transcriptional regulator, AcrR family n=1 Tax=Nakamurella panacisegetis TaxID=1090615 RepID=A0A1H0QHM7_9ACTN|nr:TetR/AcrR family transcriptional regulator [Nakamurella panacisegetis]SDP16832.1 DNA-binding transcriptional regulator, AcrR family [Nakamurella panacisegetis]
MHPSSAETPLRSDARRTRERLLEAAAQLLEAGGQHFTLPDLARQAGVGTATVYRHFADVGEVLAAVEVQSIEGLTAAISAVDPNLDARVRFESVCALWVGRSSRESAPVRFLRSPEGVLERAHRGDPSITALVSALGLVVAALIDEHVVPDQDLTAAVLIWITLFDERTVVDLSRTHGWTTHKITDYLGRALLGALGAESIA